MSSLGSTITCRDYTPLAGAKRCTFFQDGGTCSRDDHFLCTEWELRNRHLLPARPAVAPALLEPAPKPRPAPPSASAGAHSAQPRPATTAPKAPELDLFGKPLCRPAPALAGKPKPTSTVPAMAPMPLPSATPTVDVDQLRGFTTDDILSFKARGLEVCLSAAPLGDVWLVPALTGQNRLELTPEHAATVVRVMSIFPGAQVLSIKVPQQGAAT